MNEATLLEKIRRSALWAAITSAVILLVLMILQIWEVIDLKGGSVLGKITSSLAIILFLSIVTVLVMLFSSRIRRSED